MRARRMMACVLLLAGGAFSAAGAQGGPPMGPPGGRSRGGMGRGDTTPMSEEQRVQVERRLQERINQIVRQRLALTDEQFVKLRDVASRVEDERRTLRREDMAARFAMRQELLAGAKADESKVADLLDKMPRFERRRLELMEREQRELAKFLSPTQRARYIGLQDELRRGMQDLQRRRMEFDSGGAAGARPGVRRQQRPPGSP